MDHAVPRHRGLVAPNLRILRRWRHADVIPIVAGEPDDAPDGLEMQPGDERYYELGCLPPRRRDAG